MAAAGFSGVVFAGALRWGSISACLMITLNSGNAACLMGAPTIVDMGETGSRSYWKFNPDVDVVFVNSKGIKTGNLRVDGGRNILILGGEFIPQADEKSSATISLQGMSGDVELQGIRIDNSRAGERDGVGVAGADGHSPAVTIRDSRIENIQGTKDGTHGDIFQPYGPIRSLHVTRLTGSTAYQGLFLEPHFDPFPEEVRLESVNIIANQPGFGQPQPKLYWFYDQKLTKGYPVFLADVFIQGSTATSAVHKVYPPGSRLEDNVISWPTLPIEGSITVASPPGGDFAKLEVSGKDFDYRSALVDHLLDRLALLTPQNCLLQPETDGSGPGVPAAP